MKKPIYLAFLGLFFVSCQSYQYLRLTSDLPQTSDTGHYYVSDSLAYVDFDFNGEYFPVRILFLNESEGDLTIDLNQLVFSENGRIVGRGSDYLSSSLNPMVRIPHSKSESFVFRPYSIHYYQMEKQRSGYHIVQNNESKDYVTGRAFGGEGRSFEIDLIYLDQHGTEHKLEAEFKEDFIYFSPEVPSAFPGGVSPNVHFVSKESEGGRIAAALFLEAVSISMDYWLYTNAVCE